ncbi:MAG: hypothetical protein ACTSP4_06930 [Candidatus Hodarchaeales archaeon]
MSEKPFKCIYCDAEYDDKESLDRHVEYAHTLYRQGDMKRTEKTSTQKIERILKRHPIIWSALAFIIWYIISAMFPQTWPFNDGFMQMMALSLLGLGLGVALIYELLNFGG